MEEASDEIPIVARSPHEYAEVDAISFFIGHFDSEGGFQSEVINCRTLFLVADSNDWSLFRTFIHVGAIRLITFALTVHSVTSNL